MLGPSIEECIKDPRPEDVPFFESQRDCKSLSARVHAARALLKLGHNQVVNEQIAFWLHVVDSPELLEQITKMDSDPNGRIELVNFLTKCGRKFLTQVQESADNVQRDKRAT